MAVQTRLDECLSIRDGRLFVEECDADELARRFGTPVHVISEDQLRRNARRYRREFEQRWTDVCNFNALPRPGMVLVHGEQAEWIKRPETVADVFKRDVVPARLRRPR
jgi:hypothetical protein